MMYMHPCTLDLTGCMQFVGRSDGSYHILETVSTLHDKSIFVTAGHDLLRRSIQHAAQRQQVDTLQAPAMQSTAVQVAFSSL